MVLLDVPEKIVGIRLKVIPLLNYGRKVPSMTVTVFVGIGAGNVDVSVNVQEGIFYGKSMGTEAAAVNGNIHALSDTEGDKNVEEGATLIQGISAHVVHEKVGSILKNGGRIEGRKDTKGDFQDTSITAKKV